MKLRRGNVGVWILADVKLFGGYELAVLEDAEGAFVDDRNGLGAAALPPAKARAVRMRSDAAAVKVWRIMLSSRLEFIASWVSDAKLFSKPNQRGQQFGGIVRRSPEGVVGEQVGGAAWSKAGGATESRASGRASNCLAMRLRMSSKGASRKNTVALGSIVARGLRAGEMLLRRGQHRGTRQAGRSCLR